jgi:hypothetical protein
MSSKTLRALLLAAALLAPALRAEALAIYSADVVTQFSVTGFFDSAGTAIAKPADLVVEGTAQVFDRFQSATPGATASASAVPQVIATDPLDLVLGEGPRQEASASGSAAFPPVAMSDAIARTDGLVFLDNQSFLETYRVDFELAVTWSVDAAVSLAGETARSTISVLLDTLSGGVLFELDEIADTQTSDPSGADTVVFFGSVLLGPRDFDEIAIETDATGAASAVPEPASAVLIGLGAGLLAGGRRIRR